MKQLILALLLPLSLVPLASASFDLRLIRTDGAGSIVDTAGNTNVARWVMTDTGISNSPTPTPDLDLELSVPYAGGLCLINPLHGSLSDDGLTPVVTQVRDDEWWDNDLLWHNYVAGHHKRELPWGDLDPWRDRLLFASGAGNLAGEPATDPTAYSLMLDQVFKSGSKTTSFNAEGGVMAGTTAAVPEPGTVGLFGTILALCALRRRKCVARARQA